MKNTLKWFAGSIICTFIFLFAVAVPGTNLAEAYTGYSNNYSSNYYPYYDAVNKEDIKNNQSDSSSFNNVSTSDEQEMLNMINKERTDNGLSPLASDAKLTQLARMKAQDMIDKDYFDHNSPTYGSPFDMMKDNGINYRYAGENLAGATDVKTAHTNLMNSPGHKANILSADYTKVGIGVVNGGPYGKMFVQEFNG